MISIIKKDVRTLLRNSRNNLDKNYILNSSTIITQKLIKFIESRPNITTIMSYMSFENEVKTNEINNFILDSKRNLILTKIFNDEIIPIKANFDSKMQTGSLGIKEPLGESYNDSIDLFIVPGLGFDKSGNRIGFGKGYYDRFLDTKNTYKIGICFDIQLIDSVPVDYHDKKMDVIITDSKEFFFPCTIE